VAETSRNFALSSRGVRLIVETMAEAPLHHTARLFPHVVNKLADAWGHKASFDAVVDELMFTSRPRRRGFPPRVLGEITKLCALHARRLTRTAEAAPTDPARKAKALHHRLVFTSRSRG
jgi:hypothetical protein